MAWNGPQGARSWQGDSGGDWNGASLGGGEPWVPAVTNTDDDNWNDPVPKEPTGEEAAPPQNSGCRNCGQDGHFARDCPEPRKMTGQCFNCGEIGHNRIDCPNPTVEREFTGECRHCKETGHRAAQCPTKPPPKCNNCGEDGHIASKCTNARTGMFPDRPEMSLEEAWTNFTNVINKGDAFGYAAAFETYCKAASSDASIDFPRIELSLRDANASVCLVALECNKFDTKTIVDLHGNPDQKYIVSIQTSLKPKRKKYESMWPKTAEENMERLKSAGFVMDNFKPKCYNCGEVGHTSRACPEEHHEPETKFETTCAICKQVGHRARDCTEERVDPYLCRNCKQPGHSSKECPEPRSAEGVECKNCSEMGHFSRDCPTREPRSMDCRNCGQEGHMAKDCLEERKITCRNCNQEGHMSRECPEPRNPATMTCRNCDEAGHMSRDCPKPRDYSRVTCSNCGKTGHTAVRCKEPKPDEDAGHDKGFPASADEPAKEAPIEASRGWNTSDNASGDGGFYW